MLSWAGAGRAWQGQGRGWCCVLAVPSQAVVSLGCVDIGACESIMKKKTKQDFQETIKAEHCECCSICARPCPS